MATWPYMAIEMAKEVEMSAEHQIGCPWHRRTGSAETYSAAPCTCLHDQGGEVTPGQLAAALVAAEEFPGHESAWPYITEDIIDGYLDPVVLWLCQNYVITPRPPAPVDRILASLGEGFDDPGDDPWGGANLHG